MIEAHPAAATRTPVPTPLGATPDAGHRPGECDIGPAEIARRRRAGHIGAIVTLVVFVAVVIPL